METELTSPAVARRVFGTRLPQAERFVQLLQGDGAVRGVIGPREVDRLWERHLVNSAVVGELIDDAATVTDVGSGGGFPGIPLAIARPDLEVTLVEPMARRIAWLEDVVADVALDNVIVRRGRADDLHDELPPAAVVTARAVAPLAKLARWCLPLTSPGGSLVAIKGASAADEVRRDQAAVRKAGGSDVTVLECGQESRDACATVIRVRRAAS